MATRAKTATKKSISKKTVKKAVATTKSKTAQTRRSTVSKPKSSKLHHRVHHHVKKHILRYLGGATALFLLTFISTQGISYAATTSSKKTGKISVKAHYVKCKVSKKQFTGSTYNANVEGWQKCQAKTGSKAKLYVSSFEQGAKCNGKDVYTNPSNLDVTDFKSSRTLKCSPGTYNINLESPDRIKYPCKGDTCTTQSNVTLPIKAGGNTTLNLGTKAGK